MSVYGALLLLYPRDFREEYAEDMALLLDDQLRNESAARVWARTLLDLTLTVPPQHLEARMSRSVSPSAVYGTVGALFLVFAVAAAITFGLSAFGLLGVAVFGGFAGVSWRRSRALGSSRHADAHWWKYLIVGVVGATTCIAAVAGRDELAAGPWALFILGLLVSVVLVATGLGLLVVRGRTHNAA